MKPYYYIFRVGGSHPRIKHATLTEAATESQRLAAQHPGDTFEILQCLGVTRTTTPATFWMDGVIGPHICAMHRALDETCLVCGESLTRPEGLPNAHVLATADTQTPNTDGNL